MYPLKQSTVITVPMFVHDSNGDAVTGLVDGGFTKRFSKNGGAFGAMTLTITEMENGWYSVPISASHSDTLGVLTITFTHGSAKQVNLQFRVEAKLVADLNDVAATDIVSAGAITTLTGAVVNVDLVDTTTTNTDMVGTDSAALASVCTEGRLAELDAANLPADVDAILADTGTDGVVISATTANQISDALLNRDFASVSDTNARTALNALRFLRNKWSIAGTTLTVTEENDTTAAWTATVSTDAAADPVTGSDPV